MKILYRRKPSILLNGSMASPDRLRERSGLLTVAESSSWEGAAFSGDGRALLVLFHRACEARMGFQEKEGSSDREPVEQELETDGLRLLWLALVWTLASPIQQHTQMAQEICFEVPFRASQFVLAIHCVENYFILL